MLDVATYRSNEIDFSLSRAGFRPLDLLVCGATGVGKSSTLNAFANRECAKTSDGMSCCTQDIRCIKIGENLRIWDSPGLGDSCSNDERFASMISAHLLRTCELRGHTVRLIDMALLLLEARSRNLHTPTTLLRDVLLPCLGSRRILLAINQADTALCGRHWNAEKRMADQTLLVSLTERTETLWQRLCEETGEELTKPVFYSAVHGFNLASLMDVIVERLPNAPREL